MFLCLVLLHFKTRITLSRTDTTAKAQQAHLIQSSQITMGTPLNPNDLSCTLRAVADFHPYSLPYHT